MFEDLKEIGEWKDLIIQNLLQIDLQILEIGEPAVKKPDEVLVLWQVDKHQIVEEIVHPIPLKNHLQDSIPIINTDLLRDLIGLLKMTTILKTQHFLIQIKVFLELIEGLQKALVQVQRIKDPLLQVHIHPLQESRDQEITVQDSMINPTIIIC